MYLVKELSTEVASLYWHKSESASLFSFPELLKSLGLKSRFFGGYKNDDLLIVWPLIETNTGYNLPPAFSYYFGPYWINNQLFDKPYKRFRNNLEVLNCLIEKINLIAPKIKFSLSPEFLDLRPFQWWNFHKPQNGQFKINLRYTAKYIFYKNINEENIINSFRLDDKRKKIKQIEKQKQLSVFFGVSQSVDFYLEMYKNTILRSGGKIELKELEFLGKIIEISSKKLNTSVTSHLIELNGKDFDSPLGFQIILIGKDQSYAVAQSTNEEGRKLNGNVFLNYKSLCYANSQKVLSFDFNGANSPNRADDKHAFGASEASYYELSLE